MSDPPTRYIETLDLPADLEVEAPEEPPATQPATTLGTSLTAVDEHEIDNALVDAGLWTPGKLPDIASSYHRDVAIAEASGRWHPQQDGQRGVQPRHRDYVAGDVCGLRAAAFGSALMLYHDELSEWSSDQTLDPTERLRIERAIALGAWGLAAVPYFLPVTSAVGITGSYPPDGELLDELRLPFVRVAVYFGGDLTIPAGLIGADDRLIAVAARTNEAYRRGIRRFRADDLPPTSLNNAQIALARGEEVHVAGVALHADHTGRLGDLALWFTVTPSDPIHPRRLTPGLLPQARARPLVLNLAAALAWGDWEPPPADLDLPSDPASPGFRRQVRRGQFRRREPLGAAAGVRVLDVRRMNRLAADAGGTHVSPATHLRRGHWRRQRVGPRSDWRLRAALHPAGRGQPRRHGPGDDHLPAAHPTRRNS